MGDPKKLRKKYSTPIHPWNAETIAAEKEIIKEFSLGNKKEIWKMNSILKKYKALAKKLIAVKTEQGEKEKKQMMDKLQRLGMIQPGAELDDVLSLETKDIMERRLQSLVFRKGLARSMKQARQFIVHRHVMVGDKKITAPSYIVSQEEEAQIKFDGNSALSSEEHPERVNLNKEIREEAEAVKPKKKKAEAVEETLVKELEEEAPKAEEAPQIAEEAETKEEKKE